MAEILLAIEPVNVDHLPDWPYVVAFVAAILAIGKLAPGLSALWRALSWLARHISPRRFTPNARVERAERCRIATLLLQTLDLLEADLHWQRDTFTEVRATIEAVDTLRRTHGRLFGLGRVKVTSRARSLSAALTHEKNRFVLLQAAPGAGKSVAMRHYARRLLEQAVRGRNSAVPLAVCVSLRDFDVSPDEVTAEKLEKYIAAQANVGGARRLSEYFRNTFAADLAAGRITLLLDSFDEIPAVLGSSNIDQAVRPYVSAITGLMGGGESRCVVAAREYKGPRVPGWTRLEIVGLQFDEQCELLRAYGVSAAEIRSVETLLRDPRAGFTTDLRNLLHLTLLADYLDAKGHPPARPSELFEDYATSRLSGADIEVDEAEVGTLRRALQAFSFELTRSAQAGLSAEEDMLRATIVGCLPGGRPDTVDRLLGLVKRSKLLIETRRGRQVAFVHRRVQEYFATQHVLAHPSALGPGELATSGRWRETAVALLQVGQDAGPILAEIETIVRNELAVAIGREAAEFEWTSEAIHVMELLVAAYGSDPSGMPASVRDPFSRLVGRAWAAGGIGDRKFALDCLPIVTGRLQQRLVEGAFTGRSHWLRRSALRDCSSLNPLPDSIDLAIRRLLVTLISGRELARDAAALDSDLGRLYQKRELVRARRVLAAMPRIVFALALLAIIVGPFFQFRASSLLNPAGRPLEAFLTLVVVVAVWILPPIILFWLVQSNPRLSYPRSTRTRRFFNVTDAEVRFFISGLIGLAGVLWGLAIVAHVDDSIAAISAGGWLAGLFGVAVVPIVTAYAGGWAPLFLTGFVRAGLPGGVGVRELAFPVAAAAPLVRNRLHGYRGAIIEYGRHRLTTRALLKAVRRIVRISATVVAFVLGVAAFFWLIIWLAGGFTVAVGTVSFLAALTTCSIIAAFVGLLARIVREMRSWNRVRHRIRETTTVEAKALLDDLCSLADPIGVAKYLLYLRTQRTEQARRLPRPFMRQLSILIQAASGNRARPAALEPPIAAALKTGRLNKAMLGSWSDGVLDEFGRLDEFLRER
jgi:hypothetical protein